MSNEQITLDFDGTDPEQQLRRWWHENAIREREFWTPERRLLAWMQGTQPDDSDLQWLAAQPSYTRNHWLYLMERETDRVRAERAQGRPAYRHKFEDVLAEFEEAAAINERADEAIIAKFVEWIRDDFKNRRPCSISIENSTEKWRSQRNLDEAIRRAGIPLTSLQS